MFVPQPPHLLQAHHPHQEPVELQPVLQVVIHLPLTVVVDNVVVLHFNKASAYVIKQEADLRPNVELLQNVLHHQHQQLALNVLVQ